MSGKKHDSGKPMAGLIMHDFSRALLAVAEVATYGVQKYDKPSGWQTVEDGLQRYSDAKARHMLAQGSELYDDESHLLHLAHEAWNALAILELTLADGCSLVYSCESEERK